jgi:Cof subfamily protein (haloacid dehalogenase superfamily)
MTIDHKKIKVIISDLDGTLLNADHKVSPYTKSVFKALHDQNYLIIVATGRHHLDAFSITDDLDFPVYLVTSNGARIHDPNKNLQYAFNMESAAVKSILTLPIDPEITTVLCKENAWQTNKNNEKLNSFQAEMTYPAQIVNFDHLEQVDGIKLFFTHESHDKLLIVRDQIQAVHADTFGLAFSLPICLEVMDKTVDKSVAIAKILNGKNSSFAESICFGDGFNDEQMLLRAGKGCVMGNAPESFKDKLSHLEIIGHNDQDSVAKYLAKNLL